MNLNQLTSPQLWTWILAVGREYKTEQSHMFSPTWMDPIFPLGSALYAYSLHSISPTVCDTLHSQYLLQFPRLSLESFPVLSLSLSLGSVITDEDPLLGRDTWSRFLKRFRSRLARSLCKVKSDLGPT